MGRCAATIRGLFALVSVAFLIAGIVVYALFTSKARSDSDQALIALGVKEGMFAHAVHVQYLVTIIVMSVLGAALLFLSLLRGALVYRAGAHGPSHTSVFLVLSAFFGFLMWLATLWLILVACGYTLWGSVTVGLDQGTNKAVLDVGGKLTSVDATFTELQAFITAYNTESPSLTADQRAAFAPSVAGVTADLQSSSTGCPAACLDLSSWSFLVAGTANTCVCDLTRLTTAQPYNRAAWHSVGWSILGLLLMWIGATWQVLDTATNASRALADRAAAYERAHEVTYLVATKSSPSAPPQVQQLPVHHTRGNSAALEALPV